ncbi:hypothetical protein OD91_1080 [Lutibacter sp. Hel_I_33_5]|uniref:hypothetical protein n=1 Tax=Lutibacter sp. Hel_I_33_5 TaxID=1566289 RepID=UPI0011A0BAEA|nr:hypothetical protein [Lutibacter sp. Hel_I_33_5]TVZ55813.1 hypothetical protein OD91_1080 [Lutibacter sp. Hel_I_33_5]
MIRRVLLIFLLLTATLLTAQRTNSSPYSFFGIGQEFSPKTVEQASMGGIGVAFASGYYLNFTNPAANAHLRLTTYSFGILNNRLTIEDASGAQTSNSTSLNYISFGFPIGQKAGFVVGLQPISSVGYSLTNQITDANGDAIEITRFSGNGGVNRLYGSFGIKVFKDFSLGIEADYSFGRLENSVLNRRINVTLASKHSEDIITRGGSVKLGALYKKKLKNKVDLGFGASYKLGTDISANGEENLYSLTLGVTGAEIPRDTISSGTISGFYKLPLETTIGGGIGVENKWYAGLEYKSRDALQFAGFLNNTTNSFSYENSTRFSLGGFYIPRVNAINGYWKRVTYRTGLRFEKTGLQIDGTGTGNNFETINDFGMSFGLGLPLGNKLSNLNIGFEYGQKGTTNNNLIKESYFNFRLSLSLNAFSGQAWFQKRKID